jgi:hypothetical protein
MGGNRHQSQPERLTMTSAQSNKLLAWLPIQFGALCGMPAEKSFFMFTSASLRSTRKKELANLTH